MSSSNAITRIRRRLFSKNISTFIVCLCFAALLWLVHALNLNYKHTLTVPVQFLNLPTNKVIVGDLPDKLQIDIKTSGLKLFLMSMKKQYEQLTIDFNSLKTNAKSQAYSISNGNFNLKSAINFNVEILKIRPDTLFFIYNKGNSKLVPVKVMADISCKEGYSVVSKPFATPAFIAVMGDSSSLSAVDTIYTQALKLKEVSQHYDAMLPLKKTDASLSYTTKEVKINFDVDRITESSVKIPISIQHKATLQPIKLLPEFVTIHYQVTMNDYNNIDANSFKAIVNYSDIKNKQTQLPVTIIRSPSEVKITQIEPRTISYLIYKK